MTKDKLVAEMDQAMQIVGYVNAWVQPIAARAMMQSTGIQTPVGIKVKGPDVAIDREASHSRSSGCCATFPGTKSVIAERISDGLLRRRRATIRSAWQQRRDRGRERCRPCATAIGGDNIVSVKDADGAIIPLSVQYSPEYLDTLDKIRNTPVVTPGGVSVPLGDIADVSVKQDAGDDPQRQRQRSPVHLRRPARRRHGPDYVDRRAGVPAREPRAAERLLRRVDRRLSVLDAARARLQLVIPADAGDHLRAAGRGVPVGRRERPDSAVGAVRDGRAACSCSGARLPDDDGGDRRLHLAVRRRGADRHHHGHLHPRRARSPPRTSSRTSTP